MIEGYSQTEFSSLINGNLSPATPISDPNHLLGRERKLSEIARAFGVDGRHVFIYGDRGVGKTSLAQSAATAAHTVKTDPIIVSCDIKSNFSTIMYDIWNVYVQKNIKGKPLSYFKIKPPFVEIGGDLFGNAVNFTEIKSVNDASRMFEFISSHYEEPFIIVIDEFEFITSNDDKSQFASLVKRLSDSGVNVRFIFCGIGTSVEELLGAHLSSGRYIVPVNLERLSVDVLMKIVSQACDSVPIDVPYETTLRIAILSDGFPYFVHLVTENMLWAAYDSESIAKGIKSEHFKLGVSGAIEKSFVSLRQAYDRATKKYTDDYEEILWAIADKPTLIRQVSEIYNNSYLRLMSDVTSLKLREKPKETLTMDRFRSRINKLKTDRHGSIVIGTGAGWYRFSENMLRGFVRLKAKQFGVDLGPDHH